MKPSFRIIRKESEFDLLKDSWDTLLSNSPSDNFFLSWEWIRLWWQIYALPCDELCIAVMEQENKVTGIAPCYIRKRKLSGFLHVKRLMFLGTHDRGDDDVCSDFMDFIYDKNLCNEFITTFFDLVVKNNYCNEMYLLRMDPTSPSWEIITKQSKKYHFFTTLPSENYESPYIKLPATWDDYLESRSSSMRYKIRRERRKLENIENISFECNTLSEEDIQQKLEILIELHGKRWNLKELNGSFVHERFSQFHRKILPVLFRKKQVEIPVLSVNNQTKATFYNFRYKNKIYFYQSGVEMGKGLPAWGYLLHSFCIEEAIKQGLDEYDFLPKGGNDGYKDHFANTIRYVSRVCIVRGNLLIMYYRIYHLLRSIYERIRGRD